MLRYPGFSVEAPPGWQDLTQVVIRGELEHGFRPNLVVTSDLPAHPDESVADFTRRTGAKLATALPKFVRVADRAATFGKNTGHVHEHRFEAGGVVLLQLQFVVPRGKRFAVLTFTHANAAPTARALAEQLFAGVTLD